MCACAELTYLFIIVGKNDESREDIDRWVKVAYWEQCSFSQKATCVSILFQFYIFEAYVRIKYIFYVAVQFANKVISNIILL